jgi:putative hydrolase of the HAD superfamily
MPNLIIFDFDETLGDTERHMHEVYIPRIREILAEHIDLSEEEVRARNHAHYMSHGASIHGWAEELGLDMAWTLETFRRMAPHLVEAVMPHLAPNPAVIAKLKALQARGHTLAILSHGHRDYILPLLATLGLHDIFPPHMLFDISAVRGHLKRTPDSYQHVLTALADKPYQKHFMLEDSIRNLIPAHQLGFTTILVGATKKVLPELAAYVDRHDPDLESALDYLLTE